MREGSAIAIASIEAVPLALSEWKPDAVVSLYSPGVRIERFEGCRHLRFVCRDVESRRGGATSDMIGAALAMLSEPPARLLIHCKAGLSRSPAMAIIAAVKLGASPAAACRAVRAAIPHASPNRWILTLGDQALGMEGALFRAASDMFTFRRSPIGPIGKRPGFVIMEIAHG